MTLLLLYLTVAALTATQMAGPWRLRTAAALLWPLYWLALLLALLLNERDEEASL